MPKLACPNSAEIGENPMLSRNREVLPSRIRNFRAVMSTPRREKLPVYRILFLFIFLIPAVTLYAGGPETNTPESETPTAETLPETSQDKTSRNAVSGEPEKPEKAAKSDDNKIVVKGSRRKKASSDGTAAQNSVNSWEIEE